MKNRQFISTALLIGVLSIILFTGCTTPASRLNKSIRMNDYEAVTRQLSTRIDINGSGKLYSTPLITAIQQKNDNIVRLLLDNGADPNKADRDSLEPLKEAVRLRQYDIVRSLLGAGADPSQGACDALYVAVETVADNLMVNLLVGHGGDLNKKHTYDVVKFRDAADVFINIPPNTNPVTDPSDTIVVSGSILFVAVNKNYIDITRTLLDSGADVNELDTQGRTPLLIAVINDQKEIIRLLLSHKPDLAINNQGKNALQYAISHNSTDIVGMLKKAIENNNSTI